MIKVINEKLTANIMLRAFQVVPVVKNLPAKQEMQVPSLGQEDLLKKEMATHSSIFAWKIPQTEEPGMLQSLGLQRVRHDLVTEHIHKPFIDYSQLYWQRQHAIR